MDKWSKLLMVGLGFFCLQAILLAGSGVRGTVTYSGKIPKMQKFDMAIEPICVAKHQNDPDSYPSRSEALILGEGNTLGNIYVRIAEGLPDKEWEVPETAVVLDQDGCQYKPHMIALQVDQPLKILNSDGVLHNLHTLPEENDEFNVTMPQFLKESIKSFEYAEPPFRIKCDVHPWMGGYIAVSEHPFFDVTGRDGNFEIMGLEAGKYLLEFWHEKLGTRSADVTISEDKNQTVDLVFTR
ncbi:MAG: hypothetical protein IH972_03075 [Candidatus Marinimicrobia bacterium]|nr:hypothetical protein [Candidatus Neomarinimicrobiota bacterium]